MFIKNEGPLPLAAVNDGMYTSNSYRDVINCSCCLHDFYFSRHFPLKFGVGSV